MKKVLRQTLAIVTGLVVAFALVMAVEIANSIAHPPPSDKQLTHEEMCEFVASYPQWILGLATIAWSLAAFLSTWLAAKIGGRAPGIVVALILLSALAFNLSMLPYVLWFKTLTPIGLLVACYLGVTLGRGRTPLVAS